MTAVKDVKVDVVIPAYNEQYRIIPTIRKLKEHKMVNKIYVADDGSEDGTVLVAGSEGATVVLNRRNRGKGYAARSGIKEALADKNGAQYILVYDADGSSQLDFLNYLQWVRPYGLVITSRERTGSRVIGDKFSRRVASRIFNAAVHLLLGLNKYYDTQNGAVVFSRKFAEMYVKYGQIDGFCYTLEYLMMAEQNCVEILELPVTFVDTRDSRVRLVKDSIKMFKEILKVRRRFEDI